MHTSGKNLLKTLPYFESRISSLPLRKELCINLYLGLILTIRPELMLGWVKQSKLDPLFMQQNKKVVRNFSGENFREHTNPIFKSQNILKVKHQCPLASCSRYGMTYLSPIRIVNLLAYLKTTLKNTTFQIISYKKFALCIVSVLFSHYTYICNGINVLLKIPFFKSFILERTQFE